MEQEIQKAHELYLMQSKPFIERLTEIREWLTPKIIQTETGLEVFHEETEEIAIIKKHLEELSNQIIADLKNGEFRGYCC